MLQFSKEYRYISPVITNSQTSLIKAEAALHKWLWILVTTESSEVINHKSQWKNQFKVEQADWHRITVWQYKRWWPTTNSNKNFQDLYKYLVSHKPWFLMACSTFVTYLPVQSRVHLWGSASVRGCLSAFVALSLMFDWPTVPRE